MAGIMLDFSACWEVQELKAVQFPAFLRELSNLASVDCVLCLQCTASNEEVKSFLQENKIAERFKIQLGTAYPRPKVYHLPCSEEILKKLAQFAELFTAPEICDHLHICQCSVVRLEWFDIFSQPLYISKKVPEQSVMLFCKKLGCDYADGSIPGWKS
jgi:hypothetical protein